jgi:hypothetical protein
MFKRIFILALKPGTKPGTDAKPGNRGRETGDGNRGQTGRFLLACFVWLAWHVSLPLMFRTT